MSEGSDIGAGTGRGQAIPGLASDGEVEAALAREIVRAADEAIVVADVDGTIRLWNGGAERMFGYPPAEAVGRSLDIIIPEKLRERHWEGYRRVMATGVTSYAGKLLSVPATHRDGSRLSLEFSVALLRDRSGRVSGIAAIMREVTQRREADRALRARLADLEQRLAGTSSP